MKIIKLGLLVCLYIVQYCGNCADGTSIDALQQQFNGGINQYLHC